MPRLLALLFAVSAVQLASAAPVPKASAKVVVEKYLDAADDGKGDTGLLHTAPMVDVIRELARHFDDEPQARRFRALSTAAALGHNSTDTAVRRATAAVVLDHASGATGGKKENARYAVDSLVQYRKADFGPKAGDAVAKLVAEADPNPNALLLAGLLEVKAAVDDLRKLAGQATGPPSFQTVGWTAAAALARMGDADMAKFCAATVENEKDIVQRDRHLWLLSYTRGDAAKKLLIGYLNSDERLPGVKPGIEGHKIALTALTQLAGTVQDFPVKRDMTHTYTAEQLAAARKWVKEQKELRWKE